MKVEGYEEDYQKGEDTTTITSAWRYIV
jgi:hypothetical protein